MRRTTASFPSNAEYTFQQFVLWESGPLGRVPLSNSGNCAENSGLKHSRLARGKPDARREVRKANASFSIAKVAKCPRYSSGSGNVRKFRRVIVASVPKEPINNLW